MLWTLLRRTEWRPFLALLSPSLLRVVPPGPLLAELRRLGSLSRSPAALARAVAGRRASIAAAGLPIRIGAPAGAVARAAPADPTARGQRVLELYFHQLFADADGSTLLDLRYARFADEGAALAWSPSGLLADLGDVFLRAVRALYRGFYRGDDALFREGLAALGLTEAEAAIRSQFGEGQQRAVAFSLRDFQQKSLEVLLRCQATGSRIDPGFLPLGLLLATLYEHLEALGVPFDVRAAYHAADPCPSSRSG